MVGEHRHPDEVTERLVCAVYSVFDFEVGVDFAILQDIPWQETLLIRHLMVHKLIPRALRREIDNQLDTLPINIFESITHLGERVWWGRGLR